jgi:serine O-acetyltransferase
MSNSNFSVDLKRYGGFKAFLREQSIWAVLCFRIGSRILKIENQLLRGLLKLPYYFVFRAIETITGISIPPETIIGPGLRIYHFGQIFINARAIIGSNCTLRQGVTIGSINEDEGAPVIGDNVEFGFSSAVMGAIVVGDNVMIGAMSLVNKDVPANSIVRGIPAKSSQ